MTSNVPIYYHSKLYPNIILRQVMSQHITMTSDVTIMHQFGRGAILAGLSEAYSKSKKALPTVPPLDGYRVM